MGESQFSRYLKELSDEVTCITVSNLEQADEQTATLKVEFVFRGKNEVQKHDFKLLAGAWKITKVGGAEQVARLRWENTRPLARRRKCSGRTLKL